MSSRRSIRLRPVRREPVDLLRLAAAVAALAAEAERRAKDKVKESQRAAGSGS